MTEEDKQKIDKAYKLYVTTNSSRFRHVDESFAAGYMAGVESKEIEMTEKLAVKLMGLGESILPSFSFNDLLSLMNRLKILKYDG